MVNANIIITAVICILVSAVVIFYANSQGYIKGSWDPDKLNYCYKNSCSVFGSNLTSACNVTSVKDEICPFVPETPTCVVSGCGLSYMKNVCNATNVTSEICPSTAGLVNATGLVNKTTSNLNVTFFYGNDTWNITGGLEFFNNGTYANATVGNYSLRITIPN